MTDEYTISRRDSLKGIVTSGALIGGAGLGLGTASAEPNTDIGIERIDFRACHSVFFLVSDREALPTDVRIRVYNADRERIENVELTITGDRVRTYTEQYDQYSVAEFNVYQFYDRTAASGDKILSVTIDGQLLENPSDCASPFSDTDEHDEKEDEDKNAHKKKGSDKKTHDGKHDEDKDEDDEKKVEDPNASNPIDIDGVRLEAVCVNSENGLARFRVDNGDDQATEVGYDVYGSSREGSVPVEANSSTYFEVEETASGGTVTIDLLQNGRRVDNKTSNTDRECIPYGRLNLHDNCDGDCQGRAEFYVMNYEEDYRSVVWRVDGTTKEGVVTVPNNNSKYFSVDAPKGETTVSLFYEGERIDAETVTVTEES